MTNTKIQKRFVDHGCGFPVILENVPMIKARGVWTPDIDYDELHRIVLRALAGNKARLTGNQIKFVRHYFGLTLVAFGNYFDVSHPAVLKWENAKDDTPAIKWSVERDLRLFILDRLEESPKELGNLYRKLHCSAEQPRAKELKLTKALSSRLLKHSGSSRALAAN